MRLATIENFVNYTGVQASSPIIKEQIGALLDSATTVLSNRLGTTFSLTERYSLYSLSESDLRNIGDTISFRLGSSLLTSDPVVIRMAAIGQILTDSIGGTEYTGDRVVNKKTGVVTIPKSAITVLGDYKLSIKYTAGFTVSPEAELNYENVPEAITHAAVACAAKKYFTVDRAQIGSKYNKFDARVAEQSINDCYNIYDRPRALVVFEELDEEISP